MVDEAKVIEAIKGSIRKWEDIRTGIQVDEGHRNCALCLTFCTAAKHADGSAFRYHCDKCPVGIFTGKGGCKDTPYTTYVNTLHNTPEEERANIAEIGFLKMILWRYKNGELRSS